jgi:hypothetical protein
MARKPFPFEKADKAADRKAGLKEGSKQDERLDAKGGKGAKPFGGKAKSFGGKKGGSY